jgi:hypothetical protein
VELLWSLRLYSSFPATPLSGPCLEYTTLLLSVLCDFSVPLRDRTPYSATEALPVGVADFHDTSHRSRIWINSPRNGTTEADFPKSNHSCDNLTKKIDQVSLY